MTIIWCGTEDIDFAYLSGGTGQRDQHCNGGGECISPKLQSFQSIWGSCTFTTGWMYVDSGIKFGDFDSRQFFGARIIANGSYSTTGNAFVIDKNGSTVVSSPTIIINSGRLDVHLQNYGINTIIDIYCGGELVLSYSGDLSIPGISQLNCIKGWASSYSYTGRFLLSDEDTRLMQVVSLIPDSNGDTNNWNGSYIDIDDPLVSSVDKLYTSISDADVQIGLTGMPSSNYTPLAVKINTRFVNEASQHGLQQGVKTNGSVHLSDTQQSVGYWGSKEVLYNTNPVTGLPWTSAEIEALQFAYRHKVIA